MNYLIRYFYLICINAYLRENVKTNFHTSFTHWLKQRPEITHLLENVQYPETLSHKHNSNRFSGVKDPLKE